MESKELTVAPAGGAITAILPQNLGEVQILAKMIAKANWAPKSYRAERPRLPSGAKDTSVREEDLPFDEDKIAIGILQGMEVGLKPVQALQSIAVINGVPALYGDGALAVVLASGQAEDFIEEPIIGEWMAEKNAVIGYRCTLKRRGRPTATVREFTLDMAKSANLIGKAGPWTQYRSRMLQMRARAWTMRDSCADILKGLAIAEEVQDVEVVVVPGERAATPKSASGRLDAFAGAKEEPVADAVFTDNPATDGEMPDFPVMPEAVASAFEAGRWSPFVNWFGTEVANLPEDQRQAFANHHMDALLKVRGTTDRNAAVIDGLAAAKGFALATSEAQPEAADGEG